MEHNKILQEVMRRRLLQLIQDITSAEEFTEKDLRDHLLDNGVFVLPRPIGETVYAIGAPCSTCPAFNEVQTMEYLEMCRACEKQEVIEVQMDWDLIADFGVNVFVTREEAENALARRISP